MALWNDSMFNGGGSGLAGVAVVSGNGLIYQALRKLGVLRAGQTAGPELMADALTVLNQLLDAWRLERLTAYTLQRDEYPLTAGQTSQALDWRPVRVQAAAVIPQGGAASSEIPLSIVEDLRAVKRQYWTGGLVHCDYEFPQSTLTFGSAESGDTLIVYSWKPLEQFADLTTELSFPPGYSLALVACLADSMAPEAAAHIRFPHGLLARIATQAAQAKGAIKRANLRAGSLEVDPAVFGSNTRRFR